MSCILIVPPVLTSLLGKHKMPTIEWISISCKNSFDTCRKVNRKIQGVPQSQTAANPRHQEEEIEWLKLTRTKQINKCTRSTQISSLFPKRGDHNAKRNDETRGQRVGEDFNTWSAHENGYWLKHALQSRHGYSRRPANFRNMTVKTRQSGYNDLYIRYTYSKMF